MSTNQYSLLSSKNAFDKDFDEDSAKELWDELYADYEKLNFNKEANKTLNLSKRIEVLLLKYKAVNVAVICLKFERNQELIDIVKNYGYRLSEKTYYEDLERIERESKNYLTQAETLHEKLPKESESNNNKKVSIDKLILGYCSVSGLNFDTNKITVTQYFALQDVVNDKIKSLEQNG